VSSALDLTELADKSQVFAAVYDPAPRYTLRVHAIRVADDCAAGDCTINRAEVEPSEAGAWVAKANEVFAPAGVQFAFTASATGPDWTDLNSAIINSLNDADKETADEEAAAAEAAKPEYAGKMVVFFRQYRRGSGGYSAGGMNFIVMPDYPSPLGEWCDNNNNIGLLAHEIGHYLTLPHTHKGKFADEVEAADWLTSFANDPLAFDGDGLDDTPPDPYMDKYRGAYIQCAPPATVVLNGITFELPRTNVMSYWHYAASIPTEVRTLTPMQIVKLRGCAERRQSGEPAC
jgi:hypothetical protein